MLPPPLNSGNDIRSARAFLDSIGMTETKLLAKIATRQSLLNFQDILNQVWTGGVGQV